MGHAKRLSPEGVVVPGVNFTAVQSRAQDVDLGVEIEVVPQQHDRIAAIQVGQRGGAPWEGASCLEHAGTCRKNG